MQGGAYTRGGVLAGFYGTITHLQPTTCEHAIKKKCIHTFKSFCAFSPMLWSLHVTIGGNTSDGNGEKDRSISVGVN
jgi:hypothetical protein